MSQPFKFASSASEVDRKSLAVIFVPVLRLIVVVSGLLNFLYSPTGVNDEVWFNAGADHNV